MLERGLIPPNALMDMVNPDIDANHYNIKVCCSRIFSGLWVFGGENETKLSGQSSRCQFIALHGQHLGSGAYPSTLLDSEERTHSRYCPFCTAGPSALAIENWLEVFIWYLAHL